VPADARVIRQPLQHGVGEDEIERHTGRPGYGVADLLSALRISLSRRRDHLR
jgi:hypothetical protein